MSATTAPSPPRPDPWATTAPLEGLRDNGQARIVCLAPSVNLTPMGNAMVPVPYMVTDTADHDSNYSTTVNFTSQPVLTLRSFTQHCHGDEAGTGGGVKSGTHGGICEPISHAPAVNVQGSPVIRHGDTFYMNNRNTTGQAYFVRDTSTSPANTDNDPLPGSLKMITDAGASGAIAGFVDSPTVSLVRAPLAPPAAPPAVAPVEPPPALPPEVPPASLMSRILGILRFGPWAAVLSLSGDTGPQPPPGYHYVPWGFGAVEPDTPAAASKPTIQPAPEPQPGNVRISEDDEHKKRCVVAPYSELTCPPGQQAHHIVPDYTLRYGTRDQAIDNENRIPGLPLFGDGMSICLTGNAKLPKGTGDEPGDASERGHWTAHQADGEISDLGNENTPTGTLPLEIIIPIAVEYAIEAKPECEAEITAAVDKQFAGADMRTLGRTTQAIPRGVALDVLPKGARQDNWQTFLKP